MRKHCGFNALHIVELSHSGCMRRFCRAEAEMGEAKRAMEGRERGAAKLLQASWPSAPAAAASSARAGALLAVVSGPSGAAASATLGAAAESRAPPASSVVSAAAPPASSHSAASSASRASSQLLYNTPVAWAGAARWLAGVAWSAVTHFAAILAAGLCLSSHGHEVRRCLVSINRSPLEPGLSLKLDPGFKARRCVSRPHPIRACRA